MAIELTALDFRFLLRELREALVGGRFKKVYQYGQGKKQLLFEVYSSAKGSLWFYADEGKLFLTSHKKEAPMVPPNFCMFLRKHLTGKAIKDVRQHEFDRIIEITTDSSILIFEFVPPGNVILCDTFYNVIMPLEVQRWKDRSVFPKKPYIFPPSRMDPFTASFDSFHQELKKSDEKTVAWLAKLGFRSAYANEICSLAAVDPDKISNTLSLEESSVVFNVIKKMGQATPEPVSYGDGNIYSFPLKTKPSGPEKKWPSLSGAVDEFFASEATEEAAREVTSVKTEKLEEVERIVAQQKKSAERLKEKLSVDRETADMIYSNYALVDSILSGLKKAKDSGMGWEDIKKTVAAETVPEAKAVKEIREKEGMVVIEISGKVVELDFRKSAEENAARYYEGSKSSRKKLKGAEMAMEQKKEEAAKIEEAPLPEQKAVVKKEKRQSKKWFESFRWFISSTGFLIVAGKDASSNETLIKKKTEPSDLVFHTDIQGSAFVVLKAKAQKGTKFAGVKDGQEIPEEARKDASEIAAACSRAWSKGLGNIDVYAVKPDQVSKTPPSGMSLPKGSFMIYGTKQWFRDVEIKMSIGVLVDRRLGKAEPMAGTVMAMRKMARCFVTLKPGEIPAPELARQIRDKLAYKASPEERSFVDAIPLTEIERLIPSGTGQLVV